MPIRYKCDTCGSTLTIKEELAGSAGKCPKCKTPFLVPAAAEADTRRVADHANDTLSRKPAPSAKPASRKKRAAAAEDDFDPMAVLMGDGPSAPAARPAASPPLSDDEVPADLEFELEIGSDPDEAPPPRKAKKRKRVQFDSDDEFDASVPNSAATTAGAALAGGASSSAAKDLLTRTMEESRARASRVDDEDDDRLKGPGIADYVREYGAQAAGIVVGFVVITYGLYRLAGSMYGGGIPLPDLGRVYGVVKQDGQPLPGATVRFSPRDRKLSVDQNGKHRYRASTATTDEEGYYDLYYTEDIRGAAVTEHRVSIEKFIDGRLVTPANYYDLTDHLETVESGSNEINFDLTSDPRPPPRGG